MERFYDVPGDLPELRGVQEVDRWWRQAEGDLDAAKASRSSGHHEWACFQAQQAAEKALKHFLYLRGRTTVLTHSLVELVGEAGKIDPSLADLRRAARQLDLFYIPTRYPNGLAGLLAPRDYYREEDSAECVSLAESILARVRPSEPT